MSVESKYHDFVSTMKFFADFEISIMATTYCVAEKGADLIKADQ